MNSIADGSEYNARKFPSGAMVNLGFITRKRSLSLAGILSLNICVFLAASSNAFAQTVGSPPASVLTENALNSLPIAGDDDNSTGVTTSPDRKTLFSAFAQGWFADGLGNRIGSAAPGSPLYQGRNFGIAGSSGLLLRRAEISASGNLDNRWYYHGMLDLAPLLDNPDSQPVLQDAFVGYHLLSHVGVEAGTQNIGLGVEGSTDDSRLLTIARSIMSENLPVHVGRLGDIISTGVALRYTGKTVLGLIGLWNDPSSPGLVLGSATPPFADASVTYIGINRLKVSAFGGTNVLSANAEVTDRVGAALVWQRGPNLFQGEVELARDYSSPFSAGGGVGTKPIGGYFMYGYSLTRRLQAILRYDNFDPGAQHSPTGAPETTETGILIPSANHKLREYTLGINYFIDENQKLQINYIRVDTEDNGAFFWGPQRSLFIVAYQIGYHAPNQPDSLRGANDPLVGELKPTTNGVYLGANFAPTLGFAAGIDIGLPAVKLAPGLCTRTSFGLLGDARAPSIFGFPGTAYLAAVDQITRAFRIANSGPSLYGGFGAGAYFEGKIYPGARLLLGTNVSRNIGLEVITNITGIGRPYATLQTRIPL